MIHLPITLYNQMLSFQISTNVSARRVNIVAGVLTWRTDTAAHARVVTKARIARQVRHNRKFVFHESHNVTVEDLNNNGITDNCINRVHYNVAFVLYIK